jgi:hypothetical protein
MWSDGGLMWSNRQGYQENQIWRREDAGEIIGRNTQETNAVKHYADSTVGCHSVLDHQEVERGVVDMLARALDAEEKRPKSAAWC